MTTTNIDPGLHWLAALSALDEAMSTDDRPERHIVFYHDRCSDGRVAAALVRGWILTKTPQATVELVPCSYGTPTALPVDAQNCLGLEIWVVDFSFPLREMAQLLSAGRKLHFYDHHRGSVQLHEQLSAMARIDDRLIYNGHVSDNEACGAMLVWQDLYGEEAVTPTFIELVDDRDRWAKRFAETDAFAAGLRVLDIDFDVLHEMILEDQTDQILAVGSKVVEFERSQFERLHAASRSIKIDPLYSDLEIPLARCPKRMSSDFLAWVQTEVSTGSPYVASYYERPDGRFEVSLRTQRDDLDLSALAKQYGGGGHRKAAGFVLDAEQLQHLLQWGRLPAEHARITKTQLPYHEPLTNLWSHPL